MPETYLNATTVEGHLQPRIYQAQRLPKAFAHTLHVVIIVKRTLPTHAWAPVILFSRDLALPSDLWRDDSCLRFQSECNFREATQYWGLEDS